MTQKPVPPRPAPRPSHRFAKTLTSAQRARLKALAHSLKPVVQVGGGGVTDTVAQEIVRALTSHELIKIQLPGQNSAEEKEEAAAALTSRFPPHTHVVARIGRSLILYLEKTPDENTKHPLASL